MARKIELYSAVIQLGGRVANQAAWRAIGQRCGYTARRDLAGFFGGREPSMVRRTDGSRVITAAGCRRARALGI